jgi:hypothetical protein
MVAIKCSNCTKWSGGKLDLQSTSADFIYAYGLQTPLNPSNPSSDFFIHISNGKFKLNLQKSRINGTNATTQPAIEGAPSGGLKYRQKVVILSLLIIGHSNTRSINGFGLGNYVSTWSGDHQISQNPIV